MIYEVSRDGDTSSSCSECKRENGEHHHHSNREEQSSEEEGSPLRLAARHPQPHSELVRVLQEDNMRLKLINQDQQQELKDLRYKLQMNKLKTMMPSTLHSKDPLLLRNRSSQGQITPKCLTHMQSPLAKPRPPPLPASPFYTLQVVLLQKQLKQFQLRVLQMSNKMREHQQRQVWMSRFIISFVTMAEQLSVNYGGKMQLRGLNLRRKTKLSWKYVKGLIAYLIK